MKRILVWGLSNNRAGTEAVIYNYASRIHEVAFDFLCYDYPENYRDLIEGESPNRFFVIPIKIKHPIEYERQLRSFMAEHGSEYCALWFNVNDAANIDLLSFAKRAGIERRITHIHNSGVEDRLITKVATALNKEKCNRLTTERWACSESAGKFLYGDRDYRIIPNMVDAARFAFDEAKRDAVRREYGLQDNFVIGTMGRLNDQKNPMFLIELLPELLKLRPDATWLCVGEGPLREAMETRAAELGVSQAVVFAGVQKDAQAFYSAFDVYAMPSLYEGLSLAMLEAQFNGLPCVVSEGVGADSVISSSVARLPFNERDAWARALTSADRGSSELLSVASRFDLANADEVAATLF